MPCNAHNHGPDCECGWGGTGTGAYDGGALVAGRALYQPAGEHETRPGACGYCAAEVYFHTNGNGDLVVFDDLGQPWPKHPCYDAPLSAEARLPVAVPYDRERRERIRAASSVRIGRIEESALAATRASASLVTRRGTDYTYGMEIPDELRRGWEDELPILGTARIHDRQESFKARVVEPLRRRQQRDDFFADLAPAHAGKVGK